MQIDKIKIIQSFTKNTTLLQVVTNHHLLSVEKISCVECENDRVGIANQRLKKEQ